MPPRGQSLELFFVDGTPDGIITAEIFNWTGRVLVTPRIRLAESLKRKEASYTGVYILLGYANANSLLQAYIGQSEDVAKRIRDHDAKREWWTQAVLITSASNTLNSAFVKFIESRLIEEAKRSGTMILENAQAPPLPTLSEASIANMEQFVDHVLTVLPALRIDGFLVKTRAPVNELIQSSTKFCSLVTMFELRLANGEVNATAAVDNGEFVIQPGSIGRAEWVGVEHNYHKLFDEVVKSGVYVIDGPHRRFAEAYAFSSSSAAGAVLNGRATAGPISWVMVSDPTRTYKEWEAAQLIKQS